MHILVFSSVCLVLAAGPAVHEMAPSEVDAYLAKLQQRPLDFGGRLAAVAAQSLGTPYVEGPLGEGPGAKYDADPLMDLTRADCVTFVEQCIALAASGSYREAFDLLQRIRYQNGCVSFQHRNHFLVADWIANNRFCEDVTAALEVPTAVVSRTISKRGFFDRVNAPDLGRDIPDRRMDVAYVPQQHIAAAEKHLPSPALLVFIGKVEWLFALHCGLFIRDEAGCGRLYHASSKEGAAVAVRLTDYLAQSGSRYLGITAYAIRDPRSIGGTPGTP